MDTPIGDKLFSLFQLLHPNPDSYFLTFDPFIKLMAILRKGTLEEKCDLLYSFFDQDCDNLVSKNELITLFREFFKVFSGLNVKEGGLRSLKENLESATDHEMNQVILEIVDEIFTNYAKKESTLIHREEIQLYLYDIVATNTGSSSRMDQDEKTKRKN